MGTKKEEMGLLSYDELCEAMRQAPLGTAPMMLPPKHLYETLEALGIFICKPPAGCLGKARWDEPIFILRAHDMIAAFIVRQWARMYFLLNTFANNVGSALKPDLRLTTTPEVKKKHDEAMRLANMMDHWHDRKIPD